MVLKLTLKLSCRDWAITRIGAEDRSELGAGAEHGAKTGAEVGAGATTRAISRTEAGNRAKV